MSNSVFKIVVSSRTGYQSWNTYYVVAATMPLAERKAVAKAKKEGCNEPRADELMRLGEAVV